MDKIILLLFIVVGFPCLQAQDKFVGIHGGMGLYSGDLNPQPSSKIFANLGADYGAFFKQDINERFSAKLNLSIMNLSAADSLSRIDSERYDRNLSFQNKISELALLAEYKILRLAKSSLYATAGIAGFRHNPKAIDPITGQLVNLQILGTEGQGSGSENLGERYSLFNFAIPFGLGFSYEINDRVSVGVDLLGRYTFTDYIDDVSASQYLSFAQLESLNGLQAASLADPSRLGPASPSRNPNNTINRGNPNNNDHYFSATISFAYKLPDLNGGAVECYSF